MSSVFSPAPQHIPAILQLLRDPSLSLIEVAQRAQTSLDALTLWIAQPEIAEQLDRYECACVRRTSLIVADLLPSCVAIVRAMIADIHEEAKRTPADAANPKSQATKRAARQLALGAIRLLMQLGNLVPAARARQIKTTGEKAGRQTDNSHGAHAA
ncbi:MAG: hypothetical protein ACREJD_15730 [Phycisphaerales bacterium]